MNVSDGEGSVERDTALLIWGLATHQRLYLSALKYCHLSEEVYRFRLDHVGTHTLCPAKMKGQGQRPQEWWLSSEERQGQPLLMGQIHSTGSQLTGLFFKQDLKQQGQSSPEAWLPLQPHHQKRIPLQSGHGCYRGCFENLLILTLL